MSKQDHHVIFSSLSIHLLPCPEENKSNVFSLVEKSKKKTKPKPQHTNPPSKKNPKPKQKYPNRMKQNPTKTKPKKTKKKTQTKKITPPNKTAKKYTTKKSRKNKKNIIKCFLLSAAKSS